MAAAADFHLPGGALVAVTAVAHLDQLTVTVTADRPTPGKVVVITVIADGEVMRLPLPPMFEGTATTALPPVDRAARLTVGVAVLARTPARAADQRAALGLNPPSSSGR